MERRRTGGATRLVRSLGHQHDEGIRARFFCFRGCRLRWRDGEKVVCFFENRSCAQSNLQSRSEG
jgi:hypothetical protein